jgi:dTMP kinase
MEKPLKGLLITLEGGEGSGKSTIMARLKADLESNGHDCLVTREPGGSTLGSEIRSLLLTTRSAHPIHPMAELMLFLADRAQHIQEVIRPALEEGKVVICDRYNDSTIAYQGFGRGLDIPTVQEICERVSGRVKPFVTLYLDVDPKTGLERAKQAAKEDSAAGEMDRIESEELAFHRQLRKGFHWLIEQNPDRMILIDANRPLEDVYEETKTLFFDRIKGYV